MSIFPTVQIAELVKKGEASLQTGPFGTQLKASDYVDEGIPVINVRNIGFGDIRPENLEYLDARMVEKLSAHLLEEDDIVFGRKGAVERHAFIGKIGLGWIQGSDCLRLRLNSERVNNRFISYYFKTQEHQDWMKAVCSFGATMASLNQDIVKLIILPLPPLETQKKIAAILSAYDDLIENNKRRIALLENMAEEIYREWFVRFRFPNYKNAEFEKGIPKGWVELPISQILDFKSGFAFKSETYVNDGKYGVVTIKNVHDGKFISDCTDTINDLPSRLPKHCLIKNADILMSLTGNVGRVCLAQGGNLLLNQRVVVIKPKNSQHQSFIYWLFRQKSMMTLCEMISTGTAQQNLSPIKLGNQEIICPANDVLLSFDEKITPITKMTLSLRAQITHLEKMRNQLLPRLISGKLTVENLNIQFPPSMVEAT